MRSTQDYINLIPPEHSDKPNFVATVALNVDVLARLQTFMAALPYEFDLDNAVGVQLDAVGERAGRSREVPFPLQGLFFSFGISGRGWGQGVWKGPYDTGTGIYKLDDETYRRLIRSKILTNNWDGTVQGAQAVFDAYFQDPATNVFVYDDTISTPGMLSADMRFVIAISGKTPSLVDLSLLADGLVGVKPEGVNVSNYVTSNSGSPLFGFGADNQFISGFGKGAWGVTPQAFVNNPS